jgi:antitoxin (DNA-binding transcriptional repressor) of toxin-antitoxin stability system
MIESMGQIHMTEAEVTNNFAAAMEKIQQGAEIIVERDERPVAVIKPPQFRGRSIDECIALAKAYEERLGYAPMPDPDFAKDVQAAIDAHREPLDISGWG